MAFLYNVYFLKIKIEERRKFVNRILATEIKIILKNVFYYSEHKII